MNELIEVLPLVITDLLFSSSLNFSKTNYINLSFNALLFGAILFQYIVKPQLYFLRKRSGSDKNGVIIWWSFFFILACACIWLRIEIWPSLIFLILFYSGFYGIFRKKPFPLKSLNLIILSSWAYRNVFIAFYNEFMVCIDCKDGTKSFFKDLKDELVFGHHYATTGLYIIITNAVPGLILLSLSAIIGMFFSSVSVLGYPILFLKKFGTGMIVWSFLAGYSLEATLPYIGKAFVLENPPTLSDIRKAKGNSKKYFEIVSSGNKSLAIRGIVFFIIGSIGTALYCIDLM